MRWRRKLPCEPSSVTVSRDVAGRYFVSLLCMVDVCELSTSDRRSGQGAWCEVHEAHRSLVREQWLAGHASAWPGVSTVGGNHPVSSSSKDHRPPCAILNVQICTSLK